MPAAQKPNFEQSRLDELASYNILDTLPEKAYDDILELVAIICDTPIALISFVDRERQWFKSKRGLNIDQTPRELAFCAHAILSPNETLIVEDATKDDRFSDNILVTGSPDIRFYAGCPLTTRSGHSMGTLCTIDTAPKVLSKQQIQSLEILARNVVNLLELRLSEVKKTNLIKELKRLNTDLESFAYAASHDLKSPLQAINNLSKWLETDLNEIVNHQSHEYLRLIRQRAERMENLLDSLLQYYNLERNNFRTETVSAHSMMKELTDFVDVPPGFNIQVYAKFDDIYLPREPLFLVLHSLVENALMHHDKATGTVCISMNENDQFYVFSISDDGPGIPEKYQDKVFKIFQTLKPRDKVESSGMGLAIVKKIVTKFNGTIKIISPKKRGTTFVLNWPKAR